MGRQSEEALKVVSVEELMGYLSKEHSVYMQHGAQTYYITDANDIYWRAQDTNRLNEKGHFVDCSELIPILREFVELHFLRDNLSKMFLIHQRSIHQSKSKDKEPLFRLSRKKS